MGTKPEVDSSFDAVIERLGINGEGVARHLGFTLFIDGALPEESVHVHVTESRKTYGRAEVLQILTASPNRATPPCPLFGRCGGCQLMHMDYPMQLNFKRQRVVDAIERIGKLKCTVAPCEPSEASLAYRNKIQLPVKMGKEGLSLGLYAKESHDLIEIEACLIHCPLGEKVFQGVAKILKNSKLTAYDAKTQSGELKHIVIKTAVQKNEVLVVLVTNGSGSPELLSVADQIIQALVEVKGVIQNRNSLHSNVILSDDFHVLVGASCITEMLCGLSFKVSPASFFQVNPAQAQKLYEKAVSLCDLRGEEVVLDAYCGVGTLSLILAQRAKNVIGVECVAQAISDAEENARLNGISNTRFVCDYAEKFIATLGAIDVALLNPPRKGCEPIFLETLAKLSPKKIVYISCDPATLARDLAILSSKGYFVEEIHPFDMFPQTAHVESIVRLTRCT